ncbi:MAG: RAM signaling network component [Alyxoria varia]|nr:MAG: RAM signaling network component [Alyxoria varia]
MADDAPSSPVFLNDDEVLEKAHNQVQPFHDVRQQRSEGGEVLESIGSIHFSNNGLSTLPAQLVDIIKDEAERLALDRNRLTGLSGLAPRFSEFTRLKYLVMRHNEIVEFPEAILSVPTLECLDLRCNFIESLPEDLSRLTNLKVFSIEKNEVTRLPVCISKMVSLRCLTTRRNPIEFPPKHEWKISSRTSDGQAQNRTNDLDETKEIKRVLLNHLKAQDSATQSESETIRPTRRQPGSRFPIRPSVGSVDLSSTAAAAAPSAMPKPLTPNKDVARAPASSKVPARPTLEPLITNSNERNRSSSESHVSTSVRQKRMGFHLSRGGQGSDQMSQMSLDNLPDNDMNHIRGSSHGVRLQNNGDVSATDTVTPSSPSTLDPPRSATVPRLSSLPESKRRSQFSDPYVELAQGLIFSMDQVHTPIKTIVNIMRETGSKRRSLERSCYGAFTAKDELGRLLAELSTFDEEYEENPHAKVGRRKSAASIKDRCASCVQAFEKLLFALKRDVGSIVERCDPRYVRMLMHLLFASIVEVRNAYTRFYATSTPRNQPQLEPESTTPMIQNTPRQISPMPRLSTSLRVKDRGRVRINDQLEYKNKIAPPPKTGSISEKATALPSSLPTSYHTAKESSYGHTHSSSLATTVSISSPQMDDGEDRMFDAIWKKLNIATEIAGSVLPQCDELLLRQKNEIRDSPNYETEGRLIENIREKGQDVINASQALKARLQTIHLQDPHAREDRQLWELGTTFTKSYLQFAHRVKAQTQMGFVPPAIKPLLKPVQQSVKAASEAIDCSPWRNFAIHGPASTNKGGSQRRNPLPMLGIHTSGDYGNGTPMDPLEPMSASSTNSNMSSGYVTPLPATPMSAALGSAAMATMKGSIVSTVTSNGAGYSSGYFGNYPADVDRARSLSQRRQ